MIQVESLNEQETNLCFLILSCNEQAMFQNDIYARQIDNKQQVSYRFYLNEQFTY